jgi:hypothetical protein
MITSAGAAAGLPALDSLWDPAFKSALGRGAPAAVARSNVQPFNAAGCCAPAKGVRT